MTQPTGRWKRAARGRPSPGAPGGAPTSRCRGKGAGGRGSPPRGFPGTHRPRGGRGGGSPGHKRPTPPAGNEPPPRAGRLRWNPPRRASRTAHRRTLHGGSTAAFPGPPPACTPAPLTEEYVARGSTRSGGARTGRWPESIPARGASPGWRAARSPGPPCRSPKRPCTRANANPRSRVDDSLFLVPRGVSPYKIRLGAVRPQFRQNAVAGRKRWSRGRRVLPWSFSGFLDALGGAPSGGGFEGWSPGEGRSAPGVCSPGGYILPGDEFGYPGAGFSGGSEGEVRTSRSGRAQRRGSRVADDRAPHDFG